MAKRIDVVAAVIWSKGRFLAVKRPPGKPLAGYWEFPGGKVESGESLEQALARELDEELGLTPVTWRFWREAGHDYDHASVRLHFFHVTDHSGAPHPHEGQELAWVTPGDACDMPFLEADSELVRELARESASIP